MTGRHFMLALMGMAGLASPALAEGDPVRGEQVYVQCKACHVPDAETNGIGPHLVDVIGREAGGVEDYTYSSAMAAADLVWDVETLKAFLASPLDYVSGTKMMFNGLKDPQDVEDVIAYLDQVGGS